MSKTRRRLLIIFLLLLTAITIGVIGFVVYELQQTQAPEDSDALSPVWPTSLDISKTGNVSTASDGSKTIEYTIELTNNGDTDLTDIVIRDRLPFEGKNGSTLTITEEYIDQTSISPPGALPVTGDQENMQRQIVWGIDLAAGESQVFTYSLTDLPSSWDGSLVNEAAASAEDPTNTALTFVTAEDQHTIQLEPETENNDDLLEEGDGSAIQPGEDDDDLLEESDGAAIQPNSDLSITKTGNVNIASDGSRTIDYTIELTNTGDTNLTDIEILDALPFDGADGSTVSITEQYIDQASISPSSGSIGAAPVTGDQEDSQRSIEWSTDLTPGESQVFTYSLTDLPSSWDGTLVNEATASAEDPTTNELTFVTAEDQHTIQLEPIADALLSGEIREEEGKG